MQLLRKDVEKILKKEKLDAGLLESPPKPEMGDLAFPCFSLSKKMKKSPKDIADELSKSMKPHGLVRRIEATGPYINFFADWERLGEIVIAEVLKNGICYGSSPKKKKKMMIEFAHPNTHKAFHIGHVRNITLSLIHI